MGVFSLGFLVFTLMLKVAVPIMMGQFGLEPMAGPGGRAIGQQVNS